MKTLLLTLLILPYVLIGQSNQVLDTIHFDEVEWIDNYTAHKKGSNEPFTGVVTFSGELDYRKGISWHLRDNTYYSTANVVYGKFEGPYTLWYEKGGQKKSEMSLINQQRAEIQWDGPYTEWYENGQVKSKGFYYYDDFHGLNVAWYENGQMATKRSFERGDPVGIHTVWHENGAKAYEGSYIDNKLISSSEWDVNGALVRQWPETDQDRYGLKPFLNEFVKRSKSKDMAAYRDLFPSKADYLNYIEKWSIYHEEDDFRNSSNFKKINEHWDGIIDYCVGRMGYIITENILINGTLLAYIYDYDLGVDDKQSIKVKWPESVNYDLSNAHFINTKITLLIGTDDQHYTIPLYLTNINDNWYVMPMGN